MAKDTSKKIKKQEIDTTATTPNIAKYKVVIFLNNQVHEIDTDNIEEALLSVKPIFLKTKVVLTIKSDNKVCEKFVYGHQARQVFRNALYRKVFLSKLILK